MTVVRIAAEYAMRSNTSEIKAALWDAATKRVCERPTKRGTPVALKNQQSSQNVLGRLGRILAPSLRNFEACSMKTADACYLFLSVQQPD